MEKLFTLKAALEKAVGNLKIATDATVAELEAVQKQIDRMLGKSEFDDLALIYEAIPSGGISVSDLSKSCSRFRAMSIVRKRILLSDLENEGKIETFKVKSTSTAKRSATMIYRKSKRKPNIRDEEY